ncbi:ERN1 isoform 1 [Pan troglodytes]|uniref:ERN1 isoform 1 n=1 Tax=Pan troglodytes TaxID=9598 RepID=A0A2J8QYA2_PANTR|nr:ERN1 isoform 1 [Pan troglodytes]
MPARRLLLLLTLLLPGLGVSDRGAWGGGQLATAGSGPGQRRAAGAGVRAGSATAAARCPVRPAVGGSGRA